MSTIYLFGGSSEIGLGIISEISKAGALYQDSEIVLISRKESITFPNARTLVWNPNSVDNILDTLNGLKISSGDIAILAIGDLSLYGWNLEIDLPNAAIVGNNVFANAVLPATLLFELSHRMVENKGGKIVLLSSVSAFPVLPANGTYGAAKRLVDDLAFKLHKPLAKKGVDIYIIRPGFVSTKLHANKQKSRAGSSVSDISISATKLISGPGGITWIPRRWGLISFVLRKSSILKKLANRELLK